MSAVIKFANGESLRVEKDPRQVLKAIQEADEIGPLRVVEVEEATFINVDQIRSVSNA
jgi:hypothetical protein